MLGDLVVALVNDNLFDSGLNEVLTVLPGSSLLTFNVGNNKFEMEVLEQFLRLDSNRVVFLDISGNVFRCPYPELAIEVW